jgi:glycosyltransferase involved in cell wall biosynthesis
MATYNGRRFIAEQIGSILPQMSSDDELIIGDDQSNDDTIAYLLSLNDPRIKVHVNDMRLRHVRNFEACLTRATGDIVIFCDQDDVWMPEKLAWTRHTFLEYPNVTLVHHGMALVNQLGRSIGRSYVPSYNGIQSGPTFVGRQILKGEIFGSASAVRSTARRFLLPFPRSVYAHDHWLAIANGVCGKVFLSDELLMLYRQHENNLTPKARVGLVKKLEWRLALCHQLIIATARRMAV